MSPAARIALPPNDRALFIAEGPTTPQATVLLTLLETTPDVELLRAAAVRGMAYLPRMRAVVEPGRFRWLLPAAEPDLDIHVLRVADPGIHDRESLLDRVEELHSRPLPAGRPPWQLVLLTNRDPATGAPPPGVAERAAILWRLHHGLADGIRSMGLFEAMVGGGLGPEPAVIRREQREPLARRVARLGRLLGGTLRVLAATSGAAPIPSPLNGQGSSRRRVTPIELDRAALRRAMRRHGASLHDVVLAVVASALRGYHLHHGASVEHDLRLIVPSNRLPRPRAGTEGNFVEMLWVDLPIGEPDPAARLHRTVQALERARRQGWLELSRVFPPLVARLPIAIQRQSFTRASLLTNAVCTIMPGRIHHLALGAHSVADSYTAATLLENHGAGFTFLTQGPKVRGAMISDPAIVADSWRLEELLHRGVAELDGAALATTAGGAARAD